MPAAATTPAETIADLLDRLGGIAPGRVRLKPLPGTATVDDVVAIERSEARLFELVDGALVEKAMGYRESLLAAFLIRVLSVFVDTRNLGLVSGSDGMVRIFPGLVRVPDAAFVSWARIPGGRVPDGPVPELVPDLVVEVMSEGNTSAEMARKVGEYLAAGVRLVWIVDPSARTVTVHAPSGPGIVVSEAGAMDGGEVLPGLVVPLASLFAVLDRRPTP